MRRMARGSVLIGLLWLGLLLGPVPDEEEFQPDPSLTEGWYARIETSLGRIVARLLPEQSPQAVAHFAGLAMGTLPWTDLVTGETHTDPYYDGILVHKVEAGRVFEAGDRGGTGRTAPLIYLPREPVGAVDFHVPAGLGMTTSGGGKISAVQFFVTVSPQPWLSPRHPCFGVIVSGGEVAFQITQRKAYSNGRPIEPVTIERIRVFRVGDPAPLPDPVSYVPTMPRFEMKGAPAPAPAPTKKNGDAVSDVP